MLTVTAQENTTKMFYSAVSVAFTSDNMELRPRLDGETLVWAQEVKP